MSLPPPLYLLSLCTQNSPTSLFPSLSSLLPTSFSKNPILALFDHPRFVARPRKNCWIMDPLKRYLEVPFRTRKSTLLPSYATGFVTEIVVWQFRINIANLTIPQKHAAEKFLNVCSPIISSHWIFGLRLSRSTTDVKNARWQPMASRVFTRIWTHVSFPRPSAVTTRQANSRVPVLTLTTMRSCRFHPPPPPQEPFDNRDKKNWRERGRFFHATFRYNNACIYQNRNFQLKLASYIGRSVGNAVWKSVGYMNGRKNCRQNVVLAQAQNTKRTTINTSLTLSEEMNVTSIVRCVAHFNLWQLVQHWNLQLLNYYNATQNWLCILWCSNKKLISQVVWAQEWFEIICHITEQNFWQLSL